MAKDLNPHYSKCGPQASSGCITWVGLGEIRRMRRPRQQAPSAHSPVRPTAQSPKGELAEDHMSPRISLEAGLHIKGLIKGQLHKPNGNLVSKIKASIMQCFLNLICAGCHEVSVGMTLLSIINSFIWLLCLRASSITINLMVSN